MSAAPTTQQPAQAPAPAQGGQPPAQGTPAPAPAPAQGTQAPAPTPAPAQATQAPAGGDAAALKTKLKAEFPGVFMTDADFTFSKTTMTASQGFRFRLDRTKADIKTKIIPIGKKGGLLTPGFAHSTVPVKEVESSVLNTFNNQPVLKFKALANPAGTTEVYNAEVPGGVAVGNVKVSQSGDIRTVVFTTTATPPTELVAASFFCPLQKGGCCSSPAPAKLNGIRFALSKAPRGVTIEENPNGDACVNDLEINVYFQDGIDQPNLVALTAVLQVAARELI
jgi:hypothetical protein